MSAELVALMLADARLPTGGHTQSAGLEPAVRAGLGAQGRALDDVPRYCRDRLRTVTRIEAGAAVVARHVAASGGDLGEVEAAWAARTPSQALRSVSRRQGRGYLRLAERVWPDTTRHLLRDSETARPVVLGVIGAVTGLDARQVARLVGYDDVQTVVAASLKLLPVDPAQTAAWVAGLHESIETMVDSVAHLTEIDQIPADGAPLVDACAQQHAANRMRLFHG